MAAPLSSAVRFIRSVDEFSQASRGLYPGPPMSGEQLVHAIGATDGADGGQLAVQASAATGFGRSGSGRGVGSSFFGGVIGEVGGFLMGQFLNRLGRSDGFDGIAPRIAVAELTPAGPVFDHEGLAEPIGHR